MGCERRLGWLPWTKTRSLASWWATLRSIVRSRSRSLDGVPTEGAIGPSIVFALPSVVIHTVCGSTMTLLVSWFELATALERFGVSGGHIQTIVMGHALDVVSANVVGLFLGVATLPVAIVAASSVLGRRIPTRAAAHATLYLAGWLAVTWVPVLGWIAMITALRSLHAWIVRHVPARTVAVTLVAVASTAVTVVPAINTTAGVRDIIHRWVVDRALGDS